MRVGDDTHRANHALFCVAVSAVLMFGPVCLVFFAMLTDSILRRAAALT